MVNVQGLSQRRRESLLGEADYLQDALARRSTRRNRIPNTHQLTGFCRRVVDANTTSGTRLPRERARLEHSGGAEPTIDTDGAHYAIVTIQMRSDTP